MYLKKSFIIILSFVLVFQLGTAQADSPEFYSDFECIDGFWHILTYQITYSITDDGKELFSTLVKDIKTNSKCVDDPTTDTFIEVDDIESTLECRKGTWHIVTYETLEPMLKDKPPKEVSSIDTGEPCDVPDGIRHITGAVGDVILVTQVCVGEPGIWHVITLDFTNPAKPVKIKDVNTGQECKPLEVTPLYKTVSELECINDYYFIHFYRIFFSDGLKQSIGNLVPTNAPCVERLTIPHQMSTQVGMIDNQNSPSHVSNQGLIPDWVKTNIGWWGQGLISDKDIAGNLGFLTQQGIIQVENVEIDLEGSVVVSENPNLPNWLGNNARWLASGEISDKDFLSGVQFLFNEDIISFKEKPSRQIDPPSLQLDAGPSMDPKVAQLAFEIATQNELSMTYLQKIKAAEYITYQNYYDLAVDTYSKNKDQTNMHVMNSIGNLEKTYQEMSGLSNQILKTSVQLAKDAKSNAIKSGLDASNLEAAVSDQQNELDSMSSNFKTKSDINTAYKNALKSQRLSNMGLQTLLTSSIQQNPNYAALSSTDKNFVSTTIGGIEYSDFRVSSGENGIDSVLPDLQPYPPFSDLEDCDSTCSGHSLSETLDALDAFDDGEDNQFLDLDTGDFLRHFLEEYGYQLDEAHRKTLEDLIDGANDYYPLHFDDPDYEDDPTIDLPVFNSENDYDDELMWFLDWLYENYGDSYFDDFWEDQRIRTSLPELNLPNVLNPEIIRGYEILDGPTSPLDTDWNKFIKNSLPEVLPLIGYSDDKDSEGFSDWLDGNPESVIPELQGYLGLGETDPEEIDDSVTETSNPDGSVTQIYPDGTKITFWPDTPGRSTISHPDGSVTTLYPGENKITTYPDGSTTEFYPDGGTTVTLPDGTNVTTHPDGSKTTNHPDGTKTTEHADGWTVTTYPDGTSITTQPDGTSTKSNPDGSSQTSYPDGTNVTRHPDGSTDTVNPDGTTTSRDPDGNVTGGTIYDDGEDYWGENLEDVPDTSSSDTSCDDCIWITTVQFIDGKIYPMFQFMVIPRSSEDPNCPNGTIGPNVMVSQSYKTVYHLDFDETGLTWNGDANNSCGNFGTWGDAEKNYPITEDQGNFMKEKFNFDFQFESYVP